MAAEGRNKVASSLLDLQPTAVLELFRVYPDWINHPTTYLGFHGGALYNKSLIWQGRQYLPLSIETEGFDILADGKLARPKIKVGNNNNIVTNFLQRFQDFVNAKVIRKRVSVRFLDDANFDGGNPFGAADPTAELTNEEWLIGRKTQESKLFVEFELNSPLDVENFSVNSRGVVAKFCYWQYRGQGCRYEGFPIEREDGSPFLDPTGGAVVPNWPSSYTPTESAVNFFDDPNAEWQPSRNYIKGDIVFVESPSIFLQSENHGAKPLKTVYVCVTGTTENPTVGESPDGNPTYWQKDGCTKKFPACQKRFNPHQDLIFRESQNVDKEFDIVKFSGARSVDEYEGPTNSGVFYTFAEEVTGILTGDFTLVGWAHTDFNSPVGAGIFSTSSRDDGIWPNCRFINIGGGQVGATSDTEGQSDYAIYANFMSQFTPSVPLNASHEIVFLQNMQQVGSQKLWDQYAIIHSTGTQDLINAVENGADPHTKFRELQTILNIRVNNLPVYGRFEETDPFIGNFESYNKRAALDWPVASEPHANRKALPQIFMLGGVNNYFGEQGYQNEETAYVSTINGHIGPWALWNRVLSDEELEFLYKTVDPPITLGEEAALETNLTYVPRPYEDCTGRWEDITGVQLVAWWDGSTGIIPSTTNTGMLDIHTVGPYHLIGSGNFTGIQQTYEEAPVTLISNPTPPFPRYGGFPGTDGFSYGRNTQVF